MTKQVCLLLFNLIISLHCFTQHSFPAGTVKGPFIWRSTIYPGTIRNYWVYVPQQYDAAKPACLMVVQDGLSRANGWRLTQVLDSLIDKKEVPVMIGVFVDHGTVAASDTAAFPRYNRSFEYDALGDRYARFLEAELLPEVSRSYNISKDPNDRSIAGASSGAICAFNVAWERPDQFRRVLSTIGTYVGLRGADELATLVRKTEPKPLRVFLEDGSNDLNIYAGDWWMANHLMLSSLTWAGYEVNHAWGTGGHDSKGGAAVMPEALKWLWKDYPSAVQVHIKPTNRLNLALPSEGWTMTPLPVKATNMAVNRDGEIFYAAGSAIYRLDQTGISKSVFQTKGKPGAMAFGSGGKLYVANRTGHNISVIHPGGRTEQIIGNVRAGAITLSATGLYFSEPYRKRLGFYHFQKKTIHYAVVNGTPGAFALSGEQSFMNVGSDGERFGHSFKVGRDGTLSEGQEYIHYHLPYGATAPGIKGMVVDRDNILYTATTMGIQASDQLGRVNYIFSNPASGVTDVLIGGADFNMLFVLAGGKLFGRKINAKGLIPGVGPVKPPKPGL